VEIVASLSQGRTAAAQCGLFTYKSVPVIFEPPCVFANGNFRGFTYFLHAAVILEHRSFGVKTFRLNIKKLTGDHTSDTKFRFKTYFFYILSN